jgi:hypothetical protein
MSYTLRHLARHWRLNLVLLLGLILAAGLLAGLPSYAVGVAAQTLKSQLAAQPIPGRNIEISGDPGRLTGALYAKVAQTLGDLIAMRQSSTINFLSAGSLPRRWMAASACRSTPLTSGRSTTRAT